MINDDIAKAVEKYERHFGEKAPPMEVIMDMPGIFMEYINILEEAIKNNNPINWDNNFESNGVVY